MSFIPGMAPAGALMGGAAAVELSFVDSNTSDTATIDVPEGVQAGDLIVLFENAANVSGGAPAQNDPAGFASIYSTSIASPPWRISASYKIADGTETTLTGMSGTIGQQKIVALFRCTSAISAVNVADVASQVTNDNPTGQTCNASGGVAPLIVFGSYDSYGNIDPRTFSPAADGELNYSTFKYMKYKIYNASPSDTSIDMDDEGANNGLASFYIEATPS